MELASFRLVRITAFFALSMICVVATVHAGGFRSGNQAVGGVMIDPNGVLRTATVDERVDFANVMRGVVDQADGKMANKTELRMVSLKRLQAAIVESAKSGNAMPDEMALMAGLQRIEYLFVDKENNDIVIAGPAEPWKLLDDGSVVGTQSGGATIRLEDLAVAMRSVDTARNGGISCSIEPTAEGQRRLRQLLSKVKLRAGQNPAVYEASMKEAFGPQTIRLTGIPTDSRYARTLVTADYEMKRLAMDLVESPVQELTSYLDMSKNGRHNSAQNPRWWMACDYDALTRSEDGMSWRISGQGVKTLTEQDAIADDGSAKRSGRKDKLAEQWATQMTKSFDGLSRKISVFGDLRNIMDLTVLATLIAQERLDQKAGLDLSVLRGSDAIETDGYATPKAISPQCSFVKGRSGWVVTTSGGVDVNAFAVVQNQETDAVVEETRSSAFASSAASSWWWDK